MHQSESGNLTIKWNHLDASPALETKIRERFEKLSTCCPSITGGRVTIAPVEKHHRDGNRYQVSIHVSLPGETVIVEHQPRQQPASRLGLSDKRHKSEEIDGSHKDPLVAIRDAFEVARRRLVDHVRRHRAVRSPLAGTS